MTPKEKANELVDRFDNIDVLGEEHNGYIAQQCALVAVDEIIIIQQGYAGNRDEFKTYLDYWQEVKQEIEKL
jgi:hypothetical protein